MPVLFWIMAAVTMTLGNVLALLQDKRQAVAGLLERRHAGYMLIGLAVAPRLGVRGPGWVGGVEAVMFYLVAYGAMNGGGLLPSCRT